MNDRSIFAITSDEVIRSEALERDADWRLLRRLHLPRRLNEPRGGQVKRALVLDVETTGLSFETDEVIQLAMLAFTYELDTGRILEIDLDGAFEALREPSIPIPEAVSRITGLTDEAVAGKTIDEHEVNRRVAEVDLVIAHNAAFDRAMVEKLWPIFAEKPWSCTFSSIDWLAEGFSAGKLDYLGMQFGWFFEGHRALADCEACLALLAQELPVSKRRVMSMVREAALRSDFLVRAVDAPYDQRRKLKERGYKWRAPDLPAGKVWWTTTEDAAEELKWLRSEVYRYDVNVPVCEVTAFNRYSSRIWISP